MAAWKRLALLVGGLFYIVVCAVVIVLVSLILGLLLLVVGALVGMFGFSEMQKRSGKAPIPTPVIIGITLFLLGTVLAAIAGVTGDLSAAFLGVILLVGGFVVASRRTQTLPRGRRPAPLPATPDPLKFPPTALSPQPDFAPYPPGAEGTPLPPPAAPSQVASPPVAAYPPGAPQPPPLPPPPAAGRYCSFCGQECDRTAAFCQICGRPLPPPQ